MDGSPLDGCRRRLPVNGVSENVEHSREDFLADWRLQWAARVFDRTAANQALGIGQRDSTHAMRIELSQDLYGDFPILRVQQGVDVRQVRIEAYIHNTTAHRDHRADARRSGWVDYVCCHASSGSMVYY